MIGETWLSVQMIRRGIAVLFEEAWGVHRAGPGTYAVDKLPPRSLILRAAVADDDGRRIDPGGPEPVYVLVADDGATKVSWGGPARTGTPRGIPVIHRSRS